MKNVKVLFTFILVGVVLFVDSVHAEISEADMERLRAVYSDARLSIMTEDEMEERLRYDLTLTETKKFYKGTSYNNGSYTWSEISEEEYSTADEQISTYGTYHETTYKSLAITYVKYSNYYDIFMSARWKYSPNTRSYDVIALRFNNVSLITGTQYGVQAYVEDGADHYSMINYAYNGTNIYHQNLGFGISMNLVNNDIDALELEIGATGTISGSNPHVYGSYQHAVENVTLAESKYYTISSAGYGGVINFYPEVENIYDGMAGVDIALS